MKRKEDCYEVEEHQVELISDRVRAPITTTFTRRDEMSDSIKWN